MTNEEVVTTLNNLIETCKDGQEGFKEAAEGVDRSDLKSLFYEASQQRAQFAGELQNLVRDFGGEPSDSGSLSGSIHRGWLNIRSAVSGNDEAAILSEAERGEDSAVNAYEEAMKQDLPVNVSSVVQSQAAAVRATHDRIKNLRDTAKAAAN